MIPAAKITPRSPNRGLADQAGFSLPEVLMSAIVLVLIALGALTALSATGSAGAEERHRSQAHAIAQQDQARLRSLPISQLGTLSQIGPVTADGSRYTVTSRGELASDSTDTASCTESTADPQYIKVSSTVTWPSIGTRPPVVLESVVAPPSGSITNSRGSLAVSVQDAQSQGIEGITISGTGPASFNGATAANGCVIFGDLPAGTYTVTPSVAGMVDRDGNAGQPQAATVVPRATNTLVFQFGRPGSLDVSFKTRVSGTLVNSSADSIVIFNTGMTVPRIFGSPGTPASTISATPLFPFTSPTTVYAGTCTNNNPNPSGAANPPGAAAIASVVVPSGTPPATATIQLPALHLTVWSGEDSKKPGAAVPSTRVRIGDTGCLISGVPFRRTFTTNAQGKLPNPGLPWGVYDVCAQSADNKKYVTENVSVQNLTSGTTLDLYVGKKGPGGASGGTCA